MKFFNFIEKNKSIISAIIAIVFIGIASIFFYKCYVSDDGGKLVKSYTVGNVTAFDDTITVAEGQKLIQKYQNETFDYKQLGFDVHAVTETATLTVQILNGTQTQTKTFSESELASGYTYIDLEESMLSTEKSGFTVIFIANQGSFDFAANSSVVIENSSCTLDSTDCEKNVVIDLRTLENKIKNQKFILIASSTIIFLIIIMLIIKFKNIKIEKLAAFMLAFFCLICMFIFQPFTVPDEATHYRSAYHVSNMLLLDFSDRKEGLQMRQCDYDFFENGHHLLKDQKYISEQGHDKFFVTNTQMVDTDFGFISTKKALPYLASGFGIASARKLDIGPYWTLQIARMFNAAMAIVLIYFAIKILPFGKIGLAAISLIPINLHILSSCSYDAFTFGSVVLMFAYIMKIMYDEEKIAWKQLLILAIIIAVVVPQKVVYIGVAAILLIIPKERFEKPKLHFAFKCGLGLIAVLSILLLQIGDVAKISADTASATETAGYGIGYILSNPIAILKMLYRTLFIQGDFYIKSLISFFGWFELETPWFFAIPYIIILVLSFMRKSDELKPVGYTQRLYSLVLFGIVVVLTEILLLIDHTPVGSEIILGVQGRYFIPALPLIMLFLRNNTIELKKNFDKKMMYIIPAVNSAMFIFCASKIV